MWILSQDKKTLVNANNVIEIGLGDYAEDNTVEILLNMVEASNFAVIGEYKSQKRAMEIINEIARECRGDCRLYEMPEA